MTLDLITFSKISDVPIYYARQPVAPYGTKGKGPRSVRLDEAFHDQLEVCLHEVWEKCPWGAPEALVSGGCYVEKAGRHGEGRAIDIDAIWWGGAQPQRPLVTKTSAVKDPVLYLGVEAILRKHLGMVLNFWYNHAHEDHWHCDNGTPLGFRSGSRSQALFIQAALTYVHGHKVDIDGIIGKGTRGALSGVQGAAYCDDISKTWVNFLELTAASAFSQV